MLTGRGEWEDKFCTGVGEAQGTRIKATRHKERREASHSIVQFNKSSHGSTHGAACHVSTPACHASTQPANEAGASLKNCLDPSDGVANFGSWLHGGAAPATANDSKTEKETGERCAIELQSH